MYITNLENHLFKFFEHTYLNRINELLEKYLSLHILTSDVLTFKVNNFNISTITIIFIKDIYEVIGYDNCEILESIKYIQNSGKESNIANDIVEMINEFTTNVKEILFKHYQIKKRTWENNKIQFSEEIKENEINKTWSNNSDNNTATKLDYSYNNKIESITTNNIVWNETGYFSIIENNGDDGTFITIFETEM